MSEIIPRLELLELSKSYGRIKANQAVSLRLNTGEIHAVLGENGAGKSSLMKMIHGVTVPDSGTIRWEGDTVNITSPYVARSLGIAMVFQHFSLFESLTVAENISLGLHEKIKIKTLISLIEDTGRKYGLPLEAQRTVGTLSVGERQRVEIVRALLTKPRLLILDEPTSVLTPQAIERLFETLRQLASEGCSILYISHKLEEICNLCDRATVIREGKVVARCIPKDETAQSLSRLMIGDYPVVRSYKSTGVLGEVALELSHLSLPSRQVFGTDLDDVSFSVRAGEIVGVAGISGNGQQELLRILSGEDSRNTKGAVRLLGQSLDQISVRKRRKIGLRFVPEERLGRGAVPEMSLAHNLLLTHQDSILIKRNWIMRKAKQLRAKKVRLDFNVHSDGSDSIAKSLSGGNLQKFIVGREVNAAPRVLILAQPSWGVDVGAAARIHQEILRLRDDGVAVLLVSEDIDELLVLSDRLLVMAGGRTSPIIETWGDEIRTQIGLWMSGLWHQPQQEFESQSGETISV